MVMGMALHSSKQWWWVWHFNPANNGYG
jgi:hypothetical protein